MVKEKFNRDPIVAVRELVKKKRRGFMAFAILDSSNKYIVCVKPNDYDPNKLFLDSFVSVSKDDFSIKEYSPVMNTKEFREAQRHLLYKEGMNSA